MSKQGCANRSKWQLNSANHRRKAVRVAVEPNTERRVLVSSMRQALWAQPALLVRGSSRRITIMRFRPANIRVLNRRDDYLDRDLRCLLRARTRKKKTVARS